MIAQPLRLEAFVVHRPDGDFAICHCPQPKGREHLAFTACWNDADIEEFGGVDIGTGASVDEAIDVLKAPFPRGA